jgi:hypothetical protein
MPPHVGAAIDARADQYRGATQGRRGVQSFPVSAACQTRAEFSVSRSSSKDFLAELVRTFGFSVAARDSALAAHQIRCVADGGLRERAILFRFWRAWPRVSAVRDGVDDSVLVNARVRLGGWVGLGTPH